MKRGGWVLVALGIFGLLLWRWLDAEVVAPPVAQVAKEQPAAPQTPPGVHATIPDVVSKKRAGPPSAKSKLANRSPLAAVPREDAAPDTSALEGSEVWNQPGYEHCFALLDPNTMDEPVQVHYKAKPLGDGKFEFEVNAAVGCVELGLEEIWGLDFRACNEGEAPEARPEVSHCEQLRISTLNRVPETAPINEDGTIRISFHHLPSGPSVEVQAAELPEASPDAATASLDEILPRLRAMNRGSRDPKIEITVCADYAAFSRQLFERLTGLLEKDDTIGLNWIALPLPSDPAATHMALACAAAQELGQGSRALEVLFDLSRESTPDDILSALDGAGISAQSLREKMAEPALRQATVDGAAWCAAHGLRVTPSMLIGQRVVVGARPTEQLADIIAQEKAR